LPSEKYPALFPSDDHPAASAHFNSSPLSKRNVDNGHGSASSDCNSKDLTRADDQTGLPQAQLRFSPDSIFKQAKRLSQNLFRAWPRTFSVYEDNLYLNLFDPL